MTTPIDWSTDPPKVSFADYRIRQQERLQQGKEMESPPDINLPPWKPKPDDFDVIGHAERYRAAICEFLGYYQHSLERA